jgi:hypothetical protein
MVDARIQLKEGVVIQDILALNPKVLVVLGHFMSYAEKHNLPVTITSIISDRDGIETASRTHEEGRAIDLRSSDWPEHHRREVVEHMLHIANHYGAISASDHHRRVIIHHDYKGQGGHFHLQVSRGTEVD